MLPMQPADLMRRAVASLARCRREGVFRGVSYTNNNNDFLNNDTHFSPHAVPLEQQKTNTNTHEVVLRNFVTCVLWSDAGHTEAGATKGSDERMSDGIAC